MHGTSRAERLATSVCDNTTTPQPFLYPERRHQPVVGSRHAPWTEIVKLPTRYMNFLIYDSPVCRKASSPGPEGLIFASHSHTHYWYEVGMLKVPAVREIQQTNIHNIVPSPSGTWFWRMKRVFPAGVGPGSPSRDTAAGCIRDSAGRLRRGGGMVGCGLGSQMRTSSELPFGDLREVVAREGQGALLSGKSGRAQQRSTVSGEYEPDSVRAEGSSIVDEPGKC